MSDENVLTPHPGTDHWMLASAHPNSPLQAQLDQIEGKLDRIGLHLGLITKDDYDRAHPENT